MRAIIVDDEPLMIRRFVRLGTGIPDLNITGSFESADQALEYARSNTVDIAFLDVEMPLINGIELAKELRRIRPDILIVFVSAYDDYIWESNKIGGDYYIVKPYTRETLEMIMDKVRFLSLRQQKRLYVRMFGRFMVFESGRPVPLTGKAKEILALIMTRRGKEISNEEIYCTVWENRPYSNEYMSVYYNALRRLKKQLANADLSDLLISAKRGQLVNTDMFDCDYYSWQDGNMGKRDRFDGEFLTEYSWGEYILADILTDNY